MNYKDFNLGDWIGHISGAIEDERELDGNEMRDLVEFLSILKQKSCADAISRQAVLDIVNNPLNIRLDEIIKKLPPVTPAENPDINSGNIYRCSCGYGWDKSKVVRHHFCPNCGAKVAEGNKE